jgi:Trypsin-like peptidase domain
MSRGVSFAPAALLLGAGAVLAACGGDPTPTHEICTELQASSILRSQCGPTEDFTPINSYRGAIADAQIREDAVVLINGSCTGTLIAAAAGPVVITAGHCVGLGDTDLIAFNYEDQPDGDPLATNGTVIEQATEPDYALIKLDALPQVTPTPLTSRPTDLLAVIQHPRSRPKAIAEGTLAGACNDQVYYSDLDTLVGSSGAGVLTSNGYLVAVHTDGDCAGDGSGTNRGWSSASIVAASAYLQAIDITDR